MRQRAVLVLGAIAFVAYNGWHWRGSPSDDWSSIWVGASLVARGDTGALYSVNPDRFTDVNPADLDVWREAAEATGRSIENVHPYVHEPGLAYLLSPLAGQGSWLTSVNVVLVLNVLALLGSVVLVARTWAPVLLSPLPFVATLAVLSVLEPVRYGLWLGQTTPIIVFLTLAGVALARRHPVLAGLVLALPVSVKITPIVIAVWWLVDRRRRPALLGLAGGLAVLGGLQLALLDSGLVEDFVHAVRQVQGLTTTGFANQSLPSWLVDFSVSEPPATYPTRAVPGWVSILSTGLLMISVAAVIWEALRLRRSGHDAEGFATAGLLTVTLLFTSLSWSHYYVLIVVPVAVLLAAAQRTRLWWPLGVALVVVVLNARPLAPDGPGNALADIGLLRAHLLSGAIALVALFALPRRSWPDGDVDGSQRPEPAPGTEVAAPSGSTRAAD